MASGVYLLNDLFDLDADRKHPTKRYRPLASGRMSIWHAFVLMKLCGIASIILALVLLRPMFTAMLLIYVVVTTAYTVYFKRVAVMDVILLAGLYTHRILAGGFAASRVLDDGTVEPIPPSFWLLAFSAFLFLSLAFVKRFTELHNLQQSRGDEAAGRGYRVADIEMMRTFGLVSGYIAVLVFCLYINSQAVLSLYDHPKVLWFVCPLLLYWISYLWLRAARGQVLEDPVTFTLRDPASYAVGAVTAVLILLAGG
jgi:4-hydroxybenzoate polyprenyltransferase